MYLYELRKALDKISEVSSQFVDDYTLRDNAVIEINENDGRKEVIVGWGENGITTDFYACKVDFATKFILIKEFDRAYGKKLHLEFYLFSTYDERREIVLTSCPDGVWQEA